MIEWEEWSIGGQARSVWVKTQWRRVRDATRRTRLNVKPWGQGPRTLGLNSKIRDLQKPGRLRFNSGGQPPAAGEVHGMFWEEKGEDKQSLKVTA